ncbi:MAG: UbiA-like polyprenyltransferase [Thermodesulfobacteriota bacterium]
MKTIGQYLASAAVLILVWKLGSMALSSSVLPPPETVFAAFGRAVKTRLFWGHFGASAWRVAAAMALAWLAAFPLGLFIGFNRLADQLLSPGVFLTYPIPKIVFLPVVLVLLGLGDGAKIFLIALIVGYQILVVTRDSVLGLDKKHLDSFRSLGGNSWQAVRHVVAPAALPHAFTALRVSAGTAVAVLFLVESFATEQGLGFFIMDSWGRADYNRMFVGIIGLSLLGVLLYEACNYLERTVCAWHLITTGRPARSEASSGLWRRLELYGRMIKFSHTVFALPFALAAVILAQREHALTIGLVWWILVAMVGARSAAMGFNRIADARFDRLNPRTAGRAIPAGSLSLKTAAAFVVISSAVFVLAAAMISPLCFQLSFPVLAILFSYSYTKRFTSFSHLFLGLAISLAPLGAWIAVAGRFDWPILTLSLALLTYIAGFDILYACQDIEFDQKTGLHSIPARWGPGPALHVSALLHLLTFVFLFLVLIAFDLSLVYFAAVVVIGLLLILEHKLVRPDDLTNINMAFFHVNSAVSVVLFLGMAGDELLRRW